MADPSSSPLAGKRVVITRAESQSADLANALSARGAVVALLPLIRIAPPLDYDPLDATLRNLSNFDWLLFTSQNAVAATADRLAALGISLNSTPSPRVAAVSNSTAQSAQTAGFSVGYIGQGGTAADLVRELAAELRDARVLLPRSDRAAASLVTHLRELGAQVTEAIAYRTLAIDSVDSSQRAAVAAADAILFFSPSAVNAFLALIHSGLLSSLRPGAVVGAIGPVTQSALQQAGLRCHFQALHPSVSDIVMRLAAHFENQKASSAHGVATQ